mgnify:CR=1 FL=1
MDALLPPFAEPIAQPHIAFQGIEGSFSDGACAKVFGADVDRVGLSHFQYVVDGVVNGEYDYGVLPIENSSTGSINEVYDSALRQAMLHRRGERTLEHHARQSAMAVPGTKLEDVKFDFIPIHRDSARASAFCCSMALSRAHTPTQP